MPSSSSGAPDGFDGHAGGAGHAGSTSGSAGASALPRGHQQEVAVYDAQQAARLEEQVAREQAELALFQAVLGSIFSVRKPRDVVAGTSSGLKTMTKGLGLGLAALVAQPYIGAKQSGAKGFVKGVGAGLLACTASTVIGTVVGTGQIVRGVTNTPRAIVQTARGQVWNAESRKWEVDWYSLPEEAAEILGADGAQDGDSKAGGATAASGSSSGEPRRPPKRVVDRTLYDLLEVQPEATEAEVRKAFYKKSLALHPDKNPGNPEATQRFQAVSEAYRVLGDEDRRRAYDERGQNSASAGLPKIEPVVFFAALFGSHHFEPFIGRLRLAQEIDGDLQSLFRDAAASVDDDAPSIDMLKVHRAQQQMKRVERHRQVHLAVELAKRLDPFVKGLPDQSPDVLAKWEADQAAEVARLAKAPCGAEMLYVVGWIYANRARQFFAGSMLGRIVAQVEGSMHLVQSKAQLAGSVGRTCVTVNGVMKTAEKKKTLGSSKEARHDEPGTPEAHTAPKPGGEGAGPATPPGQNAAERQTPGGTAGQDRSNGPSPASGSGTSASSRHDSRPQQPGQDAAKQAPHAGDDHGGHAAELPMGTLVILSGLANAAELNNEVGMVVGFDAESGRYMVQVLPDVGLKKLKRENLVVIEAPGSHEADGNASGPSSGASASGAPPPSGGPDGEAEDGWLPGGDDSEMADAFKDCLPLFHDAFWGVTKLDIEYTLDRVVHKVLKDMSVDKKARKRRAEALLKLGCLLQEPMKERRRQAKAVISDGGTPPGGSPAASKDAQPLLGAGKKSSMLTRFTPRAPWRPSRERRDQKAKECEQKQKRMEAALAMMAAGASTEDVDEMAAARAAMEAEMAAEGFVS